MAVEDVYELAYREAVRALEHQRAALGELRGRASMLLATASIAVSLLGPAALQGGRPLTWAALVCFALLVACVLAILWPQTDWSWEIDPRKLLADHLDANPTASDPARVELISHFARGRDANARHLVRVAYAFRVGTCLLAIQMVLTIAAAADML